MPKVVFNGPVTVNGRLPRLSVPPLVKVLTVRPRSALEESVV